LVSFLGGSYDQIGQNLAIWGDFKEFQTVQNIVQLMWQQFNL